MQKQPQPATKKLSFSRNRAPNAQQSLYKQLLYAFGVGTGKTVGNGALPAFGLDDDVGKEQSRVERHATDSATLYDGTLVPDEFGFVESYFLVVYFQLVRKYDIATRDVACFELIRHG